MTEQLSDGKATEQLSIFVTGADTGVGRATVRALVARGHKVAGTTDQGVAGADRVRADGAVPIFTDLQRGSELKSLLQMAKADVIIHLRPQVLNQPPFVKPDFESANALLLDEMDRLAEAAGWVGVKKLVYASFSFLYGDAHGEWVDEDSALDTDNALFKAAANAEAAILDGGVPGYVMRAGFVYGSGSAGVQDAAEAIKRSRGIPAGNGLAGWIHETDLARALMLAAEHEDQDNAVAHVFNVVDDTPITPDDFLEKLASELGLPRPGTGNPLSRLFADDLQSALLNQSAKVKNERIKAQLGWQPQYASVDSGIDQMLLTWRAAEGVVTG